MNRLPLAISLFHILIFMSCDYILPPDKEYIQQIGLESVDFENNITLYGEDSNLNPIIVTGDLLLEFKIEQYYSDNIKVGPFNTNVVCEYDESALQKTKSIDYFTQFDRSTTLQGAYAIITVTPFWAILKIPCQVQTKTIYLDEIDINTGFYWDVPVQIPWVPPNYRGRTGSLSVKLSIKGR